MKKYIVESLHEVYVDDYENGEGEHVNTYTLKNEVHADNPIHAVNKYLNDELNYNLGFENCEVYEGKRVDTSCLVDVDNDQPDSRMVDEWKQGRITLYANHISMFVSEVIEVSFDQKT